MRAMEVSMRKLVAALVLLGCISFIAVAADRTDALKKADQDWAKSAQARNIDQFMGFLGDDAYMCGTDGNWGHGKDSLKAEWAKLLSDPAFKINWTVDTAEVSKSGDLGYTRGTFEGSQGKDSFSGGYATMWKKDKDGKWRVAVDIATPRTQQ
ncbi:MAG: hypothetical protein DMG65_10260 [Candidatus Angelobacter sp. Gp1-AA117]|nr:MAG: hypothetical protein DMG65_10260 [Candidatus Angelobacter sp. Gp1-AA117]